MRRRFLVTSNCQTGGLAAALRLIFPHDEIEPMPILSFENEKEEKALADRLAAFDVWLSIGQWEYVEKWRLNERRPGFQLIRIPSLHFNAFHPDICYVKSASTGRLTKNGYSSSIVAWAYAHSIPVGHVIDLFDEGIFRQLGYLDGWDRAVTAQKELFAEAGMYRDFDSYFRGVKRSGIFMHSHNHPKAAALMRLAKVIALRLGADTSLNDLQIDIPDGLVNQTWPVYPEIAHSYSLPGTGYLWKLGGTRIIYGLREYIQFAYSAYEKEGLAPDDLEFDDPHVRVSLDVVLGEKRGPSDV